MKLWSVLFVVLLSGSCWSQQKMLVFFDDKPGQNSFEQNFSDKSLNRRARLNVDWDFYDLPVNPDYLKTLQSAGKIKSVSRWLNGVVFETKLSAQEIRDQFPFVKDVRSAGIVLDSDPEVNAKNLDYGVGFNQADQINADCLHDAGFTGEGVYVAIIDAGFYRLDSMSYLENLFTENRILDSYNFVNPGNDVFNSSGHGSRVLSCIAGFKTGTEPFAGTAVDVNIALYLTEDVFSETEIEEFYLVAALERCDSVGVDVANISLGYFEFDDSTTSHVYADLDGKTTISARGINIAASKGIAVVTSAGNSGPSNISTPCDSDGVLCVGAVDELGTYAPFSSVGPSFDGDVKPDIAARGWWSWLVNNDNDTLGQGNGTSYASPIACGGVACLRQAHPYASVSELFQAVRASASQFSNPDIYLGYGLPDFCLAHDLLTQLELEKETLIFPNPADDKIVITSSSTEKKIDLFDATGTLVRSIPNAQYETTILTSDLAAGVYMMVIYHEQPLHKKILIAH